LDCSLLKRKAIRTVAAKVKGHDRNVLECNYFADSHVTFTSGSNLLCASSIAEL